MLNWIDVKIRGIIGIVLEIRIYVTLFMVEYVIEFLSVLCVFEKNKYYVFVCCSVLNMFFRLDLLIMIKYFLFLLNFCLFNFLVVERYVLKYFK